MSPPAGWPPNRWNPAERGYPGGTAVMVSLLASNRIGEGFADADRLDATRKTGGHPVFGNGIHYCLGTPLARTEARIALERRSPASRRYASGRRQGSRRGIPACSSAASSPFPCASAERVARDERCGGRGPAHRTRRGPAPPSGHFHPRASRLPVTTGEQRSGLRAKSRTQSRYSPYGARRPGPVPVAGAEKRPGACTVTACPGGE